MLHCFITEDAVNSTLSITENNLIMKRSAQYPKEDIDALLIILLFLALCFIAISAFS